MATSKDNPFAVHKLNTVGMEKAERLAKAFSDCLATVEDVLGPDGSRELSLVTTKMQEASFFAKRGMAVKKENQDFCELGRQVTSGVRSGVAGEVGPGRCGVERQAR